MNIFDKLPRKFINRKKELQEVQLDIPYKTISFPNKHSAKLIKLPSDITPELAAFKLPLTTPRSLIMMGVFLS